MLGAPNAAAVTVSSAVTVAPLVAAGTAIAAAVAYGVTTGVFLGGSAAARCAEACRAAPAGGSVSPVATVAAAALAKDVGGGSSTNGVRRAKGNDARGVDSHGAGSGTRCYDRSSGFLACRPPRA